MLPYQMLPVREHLVELPCFHPEADSHMSQAKGQDLGAHGRHRGMQPAEKRMHPTKSFYRLGELLAARVYGAFIFSIGTPVVSSETLGCYPILNEIRAINSRPKLD